MYIVIAFNRQLKLQHKGIMPHRHVYLDHGRSTPGIPPFPSEIELIEKIKKEFHLK